MSDNVESCLHWTKGIISLILFILKLVCLFIIMLKSKTKEPSIEERYTVLNNITDWNFFDWNSTEFKCTEEQLENFLDNGIYVTFNFKMKKIKRYSRGLLGLAFIDAFFSLCFFLTCLLDFSLFQDKKEQYYNMITLLAFIIIIFILNLIFFILLSVYYYKGNYGDFLDFRECEFIDVDNFDNIYGYISKVFKNCKIIFASYLIALVFDLLTIIGGICLLPR